MTTDLSHKTVEELTPEELLSEVVEYFRQDFSRDDTWRFLPSSCHVVADKMQELATRLKAAQEKIVAQETGEYHKADFLWPNDPGSVEEAGFEFANARTEEYRKQWWDTIKAEVAAKALEEFYKEMMQLASLNTGDHKKATEEIFKELDRKAAEYRAKAVKT